MKLFLLGLFFLAIVHNALSLKCYQCIGNDNCMDNPSECPNVPFVPNPNSCFKFQGGGAVAKTCFVAPSSGTGKCETGSHDGQTGTVCWCTGDLCNNAQATIMSKMMMFSAIIVAVFVQKFM
uniref:Uncharacterized protein n=1 Tax=Strigamia maritima TaxID=126957 RepID=T1JCK3_STRMM